MNDWEDVPAFGSPPAEGRVVVRPSAYGLVTDGTAGLAIVRTPLGLFLPGGGMEPGESPVETVVREVWEECGLEAQLRSGSVGVVEMDGRPNERARPPLRPTQPRARKPPGR